MFFSIAAIFIKKRTAQLNKISLFYYFDFKIKLKILNLINNYNMQ